MLTNLFDGGTFVVSGSMFQFQQLMLGPRDVHTYSNALLPHIHSYENFSKRLDLMSLAGYGSQVESGVEYFVGKRPYVYEGLRLRGIRKWGQYIGNAKALFDGTWDFQGATSLVKGENPVTHHNLYGTTASGASESTFYRVPDDSLGYYAIDCLLPYVTWQLVDVGSTPRVVPLSVGSFPVRPLGRLIDHIGGIASDVSLGLYAHPSTGGWVSYENFDYETDGRSVTAISYVAVITRPYGQLWERRYWAHKVTFDWVQATAFVAAPDTVYSLRDLVAYTPMNYWVLLGDQQWQSGTAAPDSLAQSAPSVSDDWDELCRWAPHMWGTSTTYFAHETPNVGSYVDLLVGRDTNGVYTCSNARSFESFCRMSDRIVGDAYSLAFQSQKDAIDTYYETMTANHIELLLELSDLFSFVDVFKAVKLFKRRGRIATIKALLGILADAKLCYSFALAPTLSDAINIAEQARPIYRRFSGDLFGPQTIHGKFSFEVPSSFTGDFGNVRITARSKLRFRVHPDSFLPAILPVRSLGLLPSLSTLWDIIPFSWLIDWATHAGSYLDDVDSSVLMLCLDVEYVTNSVSIHYNFVEEDQENYAFDVVTRDSNGDPRAGYRRFERYVLPSAQPLMPTRFATYGEAGIPDWGLASSFIYKILSR